jgi:hypothetical protein
MLCSRFSAIFINFWPIFWRKYFLNHNIAKPGVVVMITIFCDFHQFFANIFGEKFSKRGSRKFERGCKTKTKPALHNSGLKPEFCPKGRKI